MAYYHLDINHSHGQGSADYQNSNKLFLHYERICMIYILDVVLILTMKSSDAKLNVYWKRRMIISLKNTINIGTTLLWNIFFIKTTIMCLKTIKFTKESRSYFHFMTVFKSCFYYLIAILTSLYNKAQILQSKLEYNHVFQYKPLTNWFRLTLCKSHDKQLRQQVTKVAEEIMISPKYSFTDIHSFKIILLWN